MQYTFQLSQRGLFALTLDGTKLSDPLSLRANAIFDRYALLMDSIDISQFSENEIDAISDAHWLKYFHTASVDIDLKACVEDALEEGLAERWSIDGESVLLRLTALTPLEAIKLIEAIEARRRR